MIQFYKKRDFGELISDTFTFFKENGKNYFKNYILINGLLLILMVVIFVVGYRELFSQMFSSNSNGQNFYFQTYFQENQAMLILVGVAVFILFLLSTIVSYSYPVLYMKRLSETGNPNIKADELLSDIKNNTGRFLIFFSRHDVRRNTFGNRGFWNFLSAGFGDNRCIFTPIFDACIYECRQFFTFRLFPHQKRLL